MLFDAIRRRRQEKADSQQAWLARWQSLVPEENRNVPVTVEGQTRIAYIQINQFVVMLQDGLLMKAGPAGACSAAEVRCCGARVCREGIAQSLGFYRFSITKPKSCATRLSCISSRALAACTQAVHSRSVLSSGHCRGKSSRPFQVW